MEACTLIWAAIGPHLKAHSYTMIDRGCHSDMGSKLVPVEVWGGVGVDSDQFQPFIPYALSLNHTPSPIPLPSTPCSPLHPFPPSSHHLPPQGCNTGRLTGEERVKERGWAAFCLSVSLSFCVCVRLNTLFVVWLCVRRGGEVRVGSRWTV